MLYYNHDTTFNLKGSLINDGWPFLNFTNPPVFVSKILHVQHIMSIYLIMTQSTSLLHNRDLAKTCFLLVKDAVLFLPSCISRVSVIYLNRLTCWGKINGMLHTNETQR